MSKEQIIRAWKDAEYRNSLSAAEYAELPSNPAGLVELHEEELEGAAGGTTVPCGYVIGTASFNYCAPAALGAAAVGGAIFSAAACK